MSLEVRFSTVVLVVATCAACGGTAPREPQTAHRGQTSVVVRAAPRTDIPETAPSSPSSVDKFDIPLVEGVAIDGKLEDWAGRGLSIEVLAAARTERRRVDEFDAKARLGWDEDGLLVAFDVTDKTPVESERDTELYTHDSIELFAATRPGSNDSVQFITSPGMDPKYPEPRQRFYDKRSTLALLKSTPPLVYARKPVDGGYRFEARLPWALLGTAPKIGSELGLQFYINDSGADGDKRKLIWFPQDETHRYSSQMHLVRLSDRASPRVTAATITRYLGPHRAELELAMITNATDTVRLTDGSATLTKTQLELQGRLGTAKLKFDAPLDGKPPRPLVLADSHGAILRVWQPDRSALRQKILGSLKVVALPAVFDGDSFPGFDLADWGAGEQLLGEYKLNTRFYDANHQLVDKPTKAGRYGAVVDVVSPQASTERRYVTLFRTAGKTHWWNDRMSPAVELPASVGISRLTQKRQAAILGGLFLKSIERAAYFADEPAITLAHLYELGESAAPAGPHQAAYQANNAWWHEQRRQLGDLRPYKYLVHLPPGADAPNHELYPTILSLHGAGELGDDLGMVSHVGPLQKMRKNPDAFPFIVLTPQCPANSRGWDVHLLADLVLEASKTYPIDPDRLYVTGGSMGGFGTWAVAAAHPELFAAAAVVCGGGDDEDASKLVDMPVWVFHGDDDQVVATERGLELVRALRKRRGRVRFTLYHAVGHDAGTPTWQGDELYTWLLEQRRGKPKQPRATRTDSKPDP